MGRRKLWSSKKGLKTADQLCIIGSLLHFFYNFEIVILFAHTCHTLLSSGFICTRNASIRALTQHIHVRSPVALKTYSGLVQLCGGEARGLEIPRQKPDTYSII